MVYTTRHMQTCMGIGKFLDCQSESFLSVELESGQACKNPSVIQRYICIQEKNCSMIIQDGRENFKHIKASFFDHA